MGKKNGKANEIKNLLVQLLAGMLDGTKKEETERQIAKYLTTENEVLAGERLDEVLRVVGKKFCKKPESEAAISSFLRAFIENMFDAERFDQFVRNNRLVLEANTRRLILNDELDENEPATWMISGRVKFDDAFFEVAGSTLERSIQFGLRLLAQRQRCIQDTADRWDHLGGLSPGEFYKTIDLMPDYQAMIWIDQVVISIIRKSLSSAPVYSVFHGWIDRLIEAIGSNDFAERILEGLLLYANVNHEANADHGSANDQVRCTIRAVPKGQEQEYAEQSLQSELVRGFDTEALLEEIAGPPVCCIKADQKLAVKDFFMRQERRCADATENSQNMLAWCERHHTEIDAENERKRSLILSDARRGLRPNGADHIEIDLAPLRSFGLRAIVFYPEGHVFPNTKIELLAATKTPHCFAVSGELTDFRVDDRIINLHCGMGRQGRLTREQYRWFLETVIVDILYRLVVQGKELRQKKRMPGDSGPTEMAVQSVRPHMRRLLDGQNASPEARERAQRSMGWKLPPGKTFVEAFCRGGQITYDYPTQAVAVYGNEDLLKMVGGS